jgi:hypothetical protein
MTTIVILDKQEQMFAFVCRASSRELRQHMIEEIPYPLCCASKVHGVKPIDFEDIAAEKRHPKNR